MRRGNPFGTPRRNLENSWFLELHLWKLMSLLLSQWSLVNTIGTDTSSGRRIQWLGSHEGTYSMKQRQYDHSLRSESTSLHGSRCAGYRSVSGLYPRLRYQVPLEGVHYDRNRGQGSYSLRSTKVYVIINSLIKLHTKIFLWLKGNHCHQELVSLKTGRGILVNPRRPL